MERPRSAGPAVIDVERHGDAIYLSFSAAFEQDPILRLNEREFWRRVWLILRHNRPIAAKRDGRKVSLSVVRPPRPLMKDLEKLLGALSAKPLPPRVVQEALNISSQERLRWTKDGRLNASRRVVRARGQPFSLGLYPAALIRQLIMDSSIIKKWREQDARP